MSEPFLARLPMGDDLLEAIAQEFQNRSMAKAAFTLIGAVSRATLGFYDPLTRQYDSREFDSQLEIVSCMGNVSEKDGQMFVHAHVLLSNKDYRCVGGHLMPGTIIFAAELWGNPVPGPTPVRKFDEPTGLALWFND